MNHKQIQKEAIVMLDHYKENGIESIKKVCGVNEVNVEIVKLAERYLNNDDTFREWAVVYIMDYYNHI